MPSYGAPVPSLPHAQASVDPPSQPSPLSRTLTQARPAWLTLAPILAFGALLRFIGLGRESIWLDEATSLIIARMNIPSVVAWAAADVHPPLYYLTLHFWLYLGESEFAIRALSAVLGIATIAVLYALGSELLDTRIGLLSALLLAVAPLHIWYSQEARMYVMVTMLSLFAAHLLIVAVRRTTQPRDGQEADSKRYWFAYVAVAVLALYTHYFALIALVASNLFMLYRLWRRSANGWREWLTAQSVVVLLFLPWAPILYRQVTTGGGGWVERSVGKPGLRALADTWLYFSVGLDSQLYPVVLRRAAYVLVGGCVLAAVYRMLRPNQLRGHSERVPEGILFCLMYAAGPVLTVWLLSQAKPMYSIRYLLVFLPAYCLLVAVGIDKLPRGWVQLMATVFLVLTLLVGSWNAWRVEQNPDWRGVALHVMQQARSGDVVLFSPRWNVKPFEYYSKGRVDINMDLPIPVTLEAAQSVVADLSQRYQRVWLVWQRGHYSDPDGLAKQTLDSQYQVVQDVNFQGVDRLILYDLAVRSGS